MQTYQTLMFIILGVAVFYIQNAASQTPDTNTVLEVLEDNTIIIDCGLHERSKIVLKSTIHCDRQVLDVDGRFTKTTDDAFVTMEIQATRRMNGSECRCNSRNVTNGSIYTISTTFTLSVLYPSEVREFRIQSRTGYYSIDEGRDVKLTCSTRGNPAPSRLQLFRVGEDGQPSETLIEVKNTAVYSYSLEAKCNGSAQFGCLTENYLNTQPVIDYARLAVGCAPILCDQTHPIPQYAVTLNTTAVIRLCVFGFPEPTTMVLSKGIGDSTLVPKDKYDIKYNLTNQIRAQGEFIITLRNLSIGDLGNYTLYSGHGDVRLSGGRFRSEHSNVFFELKLPADESSENISSIAGAVVGGIAAVAVVVVCVLVGLEVFKPGGIGCRKRPTYDKPDPRTMNEAHEYSVINNDSLYSSVDAQSPSSPLRRPSVGRVSTESGYIEIVDDGEQPPVDDGYIQPLDTEPYVIPATAAN